jgi:hypothetical protein
MKTVAAVYEHDRNTPTKTVAWPGLGYGDAGEGIDITQYAMASVQIDGDKGVGGCVVMQGSNNGGKAWGTLYDGHGNPMTLKDIGQLKQIIDHAALIRPYVPKGDDTTRLDVTISLRK